MHITVAIQLEEIQTGINFASILIAFSHESIIAITYTIRINPESNNIYGRQSK